MLSFAFSFKDLFLILQMQKSAIVHILSTKTLSWKKNSYQIPSSKILLLDTLLDKGMTKKIILLNKEFVAPILF